ncbi:MAG: rhodanese-like domain-containing protein [Eggerthellaceae bacterium]|nr:rhodanese-like domain-containing protein [Eggerthellaceae bacterium]
MNGIGRGKALEGTRACGIVAAVLACALCIGLMGCAAASNGSSQSSEGTGGQMENANIVDAAYVKAEPRAFTLVDVRTPSEFSEGHIPGAVNISYSASPCTADTVGEEQEALYLAAGIEHDTPLVLYCRTGVRAKAAADILRDAGFSDVKVYEGSWVDWTADAQNPIEK